MEETSGVDVHEDDEEENFEEEESFQDSDWHFLMFWYFSAIIIL